MIFKPGDRVRIVFFDKSKDRDLAYLDGAETVVTSGRLTCSYHGPWYKTAATDPLAPDVLGVEEGSLRPLTDPRAQEIIDAANKLLTLPEGPKVPVGDKQPALREVLRGYAD